jgi:SAM-dependent methyltransferase
MVYPTVYVSRAQFEATKVPDHHTKFFVMRDLRDSLVSWYFSRLYSHREMYVEADKQREQLNKRSIEDGLRLGLHTFAASSARIQLSWVNSGVLVIRYEDMLVDEIGCFERVVQECRFDLDAVQLRTIIQTYSFEALSGGRKKGKERVGTHLRKGVAGDWKNYLKGELLAEFKELYDDLLIETGYEKDRDWGLDALPQRYFVPDGIQTIQEKYRSNPDQVRKQCWCGSESFTPYSKDYLRCDSCQTLVYQYAVNLEDLVVTDEETSVYGHSYWLSPSRQAYLGGTIDEQARYQFSDPRYLNYLRTILKYKPIGSRIVELGSGTGAFAGLMTRAGYDVTALEMSPWLVEWSQAAFDISVLTGRLEQQAFEASSFDAIVMINLIEHLPDPLATLEQCWRILKPDGLIFIKARIFPELNRPYEELRQIGSPAIYVFRPVEHIHIFSNNSLERLLTQSGSNWVSSEALRIFGQQAPEAIPEEVMVDSLKASPSGRFVLGLLELEDKLTTIEKQRQENRELAMQQLKQTMTQEISTSVIQTDLIKLGEGWYAPEVDNGEVFRWAFNNAEITIYSPSGQLNTLYLDIEGGPGIKTPSFELQVRDQNDQVIARTNIVSRQTIEIPLPIAPQRAITFRLYTDEGGNSVPEDPRVLNFRVFKFGWSTSEISLPQEDEIKLGKGWYNKEFMDGESFRWAGERAEFTIYSPSGKQQVLLLDIEAGPGVGQPTFELEVFDMYGNLVERAYVPGRYTVELTLPIRPEETATFQLHSTPGGKMIPDDPRILNFRLFNIAWKKRRGWNFRLPFKL